MNFAIDKGMDHEKLVQKIRIYKNNRILIIVQSRDMASVFMCYYSRESFEGVTIMSDNLYKHIIYIVLADNKNDLWK